MRVCTTCWAARERGHGDPVTSSGPAPVLALHAGRRYPVRRSAHRSGQSDPQSAASEYAQDLARRRSRRAERRALLVAEAVRVLLQEGQPSHEAVAERTGLPLGQLRWAYPTTSDLVLAARRSITRTTPVRTAPGRIAAPSDSSKGLRS
jgi:hypothetical protein